MTIQGKVDASDYAAQAAIKATDDLLYTIKSTEHEFSDKFLEKGIDHPRRSRQVLAFFAFSMAAAAVTLSIAAKNTDDFRDKMDRTPSSTPWSEVVSELDR